MRRDGARSLKGCALRRPYRSSFLESSIKTDDDIDISLREHVEARHVGGVYSSLTSASGHQENGLSR